MFIFCMCFNCSSPRTLHPFRSCFIWESEANF